MPLFQQSVIKKHIDGFNIHHIEERWQIFKSIFHTAEKQQNIRNSKEEQYQEGFLRDLFVNVLGYTINPEPNFNLLTEQKNVNNSKKADGAIIVPQSNGSGSVVAVIELKGTETTDLTKIETQAFGYKNNQPGCNYVITSNFEKLRFYIDNTTQQEEFNLFTLTKTQFELLYSCLAWESIKNNVPTQLLNESVSKENTITKSLYKDYSEFKRALFANLVELNPHFDKLLLFKKTQKLLDRFLFIFFAEDRGLLPTNLIFRINKEWENILAQRIQVSLYDRYKMYFNDLNVGAKVTLPAFGKKTGEAITAEFEIFAYNGGLFVPDEILDNIKIDDVLLHSYTQKMSHYDFQSDVDVNILGHIFENSLNEIDEIKSEIEGNVLEKTKTRRKKDGVFYTPKYITKYIVDNTVGKLCTEKKDALKLVDEDFITDKKLQTKTKKALLDKLNEYRAWLLDLTICDPACGSGAFLNQALEFLIAEHRYVDELQAKLLGDSLVLSDIENSILERNIYGVDLNDESVEIAKLSLWLRTAQKGRKLNSLNNNIKCGNSLIDDPAVAGEKAFSWEQEFPEVFAKGGFDVVIGNPPYVQLQKIKTESEELKKMGYKTFESTGDLYCLFYEKGFDILKDDGVLGFITSNKWMRANYGKSLRKFLLDNTSPFCLIDLGAGVFEAAVVDSNILMFTKKNVENLLIPSLNLSELKSLKDFSDYKDSFVNIIPQGDEIWILTNFKEKSIINKIDKLGIPLKEWEIQINYGIKTGLNDAFIIDETTRNKLIKEDRRSEELLKPILRGRDIQRYDPDYAKLWLIFIPWHFPLHNNSSVTGASAEAENLFSQNYPGIYNHLLSYKENLSKRNKSETGIRYEWYCLQRWASNYYEDFKKEKIIYPNMTKFLPFILDKNGTYFINDKAFILTGAKLPYLTAYLNSTLAKFQIKRECAELQGGTRELRKIYMENIRVPFPSIDFEKEMDEYSERITNLYILLNKKRISFIDFLSKNINKELLTIKLQNWHELKFSIFINELNKAIKAVKGTPLTKKDEFEWMDLFEENKKKALELKAEIDKTDKEIDAMVYELYGLSEEEIKIVEGS